MENYVLQYRPIGAVHFIDTNFSSYVNRPLSFLILDSSVFTINLLMAILPYLLFFSIVQVFYHHTHMGSLMYNGMGHNHNSHNYIEDCHKRSCTGYHSSYYKRGATTTLSLARYTHYEVWHEISKVVVHDTPINKIFCKLIHNE